ncbi:MAG TPA: hypothetical protein VG536_02530, partial [Pseudomonas sp.]|nr:hypothetical protein [Pseudomonas sp.]
MTLANHPLGALSLALAISLAGCAGLPDQRLANEALKRGDTALAGCAGLPDQRLANEALKRGDTATAAQNYRALADLGYSEAQVGLADIQVDSRDPEQMKQAEATYRAAASVSPRAQARLGRLLVAKPGSTEAEHQEAESLLKKAAASGEGNTLIPLAMLYLQFPHS